MSDLPFRNGASPFGRALRSSLSARLTFGLVAVSAVVLGVLAVALALRLRAQSERAAYEHLETLARRCAADVVPDFEVPFETARSLADDIVVLRHQAAPSRAMAESLVARAVAREPQALGTWVEFDAQSFDGNDAAHHGDPDADDAGRFMPWYVRRDGTIRLQPTPDGYESGDFYWLPRRAGREMLMDPYKDQVGQDSVLMTSLCVPFWDRGRFVAVAGADVALADVQGDLARNKPMGTGYLALVSHGGLWVSHPDAQRLGRPVEDLKSLASAWSALQSGSSFRVTERDPYLKTEVVRTYVPFRAGRGDETWAMVVTVPTATVLGPVRATTTLVLVGILLALAVIAVAAAWAARRVTGPLAGGVALLERVAAGDLTQAMTVTGEDELARIAGALNTAVGRTREAMREASAAGRTVLEASRGHLDASEELSAHARSQAERVERAAARVASLAESTRRNAGHAEDANRAAAEARAEAESGGRVVLDAVAAMKQVEEQSDRIGEIVGVIDEIAFRTNLLALNAAVEAARAGDQGRGFAVVAQEVRTLAVRCAESATEIRGLIDETGQRVGASAERVRRSGEHLERIVRTVQQASERVTRITQASEEQIAGLDEIHDAVTALGESVADVTEQADALADSARRSAQAGDELVAVVGRFRV